MFSAIFVTQQDCYKASTVGRNSETEEIGGLPNYFNCGLGLGWVLVGAILKGFHIS